MVPGSGAGALPPTSSAVCLFRHPENSDPFDPKSVSFPSGQLSRLTVQGRTGVSAGWEGGGVGEGGFEGLRGGGAVWGGETHSSLALVV